MKALHIIILVPRIYQLDRKQATVGQSVHLNADDFIFGSHRSHGEILAKCFSAISLFDEKIFLKQWKIFQMEKIIRAFNVDDYKNINDLAKDFILYGTLAEIFARKTGFSKGFGGSMHAFFRLLDPCQIMPSWVAPQLCSWLRSI